MNIQTNTTLASLLMLTTLQPLQLMAAEVDDPLIFKIMADRLEWRDGGDGTLQSWEVDAWAGKDLNKLWVKASGERADGTTLSSEIDLLYSRAIDPFWDLQLGFRHQSRPGPSQNWVGFGFKGEAPYKVETDINLFVNEDSLAELRIELEYEYMISRRWVVLPSLEASLFSDDDTARGIGSGLSSMELGLRLGWEMRREFMPYLGINLEKNFGNTADQLEAAGEDSSDTQWVAGLSFWF